MHLLGSQSADTLSELKEREEKRSVVKDGVKEQDRSRKDENGGEINLGGLGKTHVLPK